jgi:hypothetical protein
MDPANRCVLVCGWMVRRPGGTNAGWRCNLPFGHGEPHALVLGGKPRAWANGYR